MGRGDDQDAFVWPPRPIEPPGPGQSGGLSAEDEGRPLANPGRVPDREPVGVLDRLEAAILGGGRARDPLAGWRMEGAPPACPRCGGLVGAGEVDAAGCAACRGKRLAWDRSVRLDAYEGALRSAIVACKYRADRRAGEMMGRFLGALALVELDRAGLDPAGMLVVPVPTTTRRRLRNGGVDHTLLLASGVAAALGTGPARALERRHRPHQAGLSAAARARNLEGTIRVRTGRPAPSVGGVVLVDDVRTTGATASACFRALEGWAVPPRTRMAGAESVPVRWLATAAVSDRRRSAEGPESGDARP